MSNYLDSFRAARRSAVPIIVVRTADYASVEKTVADFYSRDRECPILQWDISRGINGLNALGKQAAFTVNANDSEQPPAIVTGNPVEALQKALALLPANSILFMLNLHIILESKDDNRLAVIQAVWNCRDPFKSSERTLVLLCPDLKVPAELNNDVITLDTALPTDSELGEIVLAQFKAGGLSAPAAEVLSKAVDSISGLSEFAAEQVTAMSLSPQGLDLSEMWDRKRSIIEQTGGLTVHRGASSFDELGGLGNMKAYLRQIIAGKRPPKLVVLLDEIEKQMAGINDSSGTGMDAFGVFLSNIQDNGWSGVLWPGFPGSGKTELGKAMGAEAGGLFLTMDMGGMKDKYVGNSEKMIRAAMKMLLAMGGENVFFIGTCNSMAVLKPELKRRFTYGTFFFDLPSPAEREVIWRLYMSRFALSTQELPPCIGWTGAEIKACCQRADEFNIPLQEAAKFISPVVKSMGDAAVRELRQSAHNRYLSAAEPGFYNMARAETESAIDEIRSIGKGGQ